MFSTIGSLLDRLQGLFSKAFLLAGLIPALLFTACNVLLANVVFPATRTMVPSLLREPFKAQIPLWVAACTMVFSLGFVLWSLNPWLRQMLEGRYWPGRVQNYLRREQHVEHLRLKKAVADMQTEVFGYRSANMNQPTWREELKSARDVGRQSTATMPDLTELKKLLDSLDKRRQRWQRINIADLTDAFKKLAAKLREASADTPPTDNPLNNCHQLFVDLLDYGSERAELEYAKANADLAIRFPDELRQLGPTRMANVAEIHRDYGLRHYRMDIEQFWLRLLKFVKADTEFYPVLEESKTQLDFAVAMTCLVGAVTVIWLPLSLFTSTVAPFAVIALCGPPLTVLFYGIGVQNYRTFSEAVRSAVDLHRLELVQAMHLPLPSDSKQEREIWESLMSSGRTADAPLIKYTHPSNDASKNARTSPRQRDIYQYDVHEYD